MKINSMIEAQMRAFWRNKVFMTAIATLLLTTFFFLALDPNRLSQSLVTISSAQAAGGGAEMPDVAFTDGRRHQAPLARVSDDDMVSVMCHD